MKYENTVKGKFISRPNRFIAYVDVDGEARVCHVKNTGRCRELLIEGAEVVLEKSNNPARKTAYDLIAVYKNGKLINIDSQAPNFVFGEWTKSTDFFGRLNLVKPECTYGNSRFDYYFETKDRRIFVEVKGVTLEKDGVLLFPDAPTERGVKHLRELIEAKKSGYEAYVFFVIQMESCKYFTPNRDTHPEFADALKEAAENGVQVRAVNCRIGEDSLDILDFVEVRI